MGKTGKMSNKNKSVTAIKKPTGKVGGSNKGAMAVPKMKMGGSKRGC